MTVTVKANHGWPVKVTSVDPKTKVETSTLTVAAGEERNFYIHSSMDLLIHEVQSDKKD